MTGASTVRARITLIVNTACGDEEVRGRSNPYRRATYADRERLLTEQVLPRCVGFDEVIVAGQFPARLPARFESCRFIEVPPKMRNRWDALLQREIGARFATGDILVFCHDDHAPGEGFAETLARCAEASTWDILVPRRVHHGTGAELNNGKADGYMGGHCYAMRRWIWAAGPLTNAPNEFWDTWWTRMWQECGARIEYSEELVHLDVEVCEDEE